MNTAAILGIMFMMFLFIGLPLIILMVVGLYKTFEKAGEEGWKAIIPVYNIIILLQIVGKPWWWIFLMLIPYIGIIWNIWTINMLSKSFGKTEGFTVGLVFLPFVFYMILGFGSDKYLGPYGDPAAFNAHKTKNNFDFDNDLLNH
ncbi:MAG: DUF5684 domain-containing protein [Flavipsychrobacter sp.]|nr:DUF5684 domain-containing protein [Flavipsychrobacter sp.]